MYVHQLIPNLMGGVSQQNSALRLENQCTVQENCHCTATDGLIKRPNSEWVKTIGHISAPTSGFVHAIERDEAEKYLAIFTTDSTTPIRVFELDGTEKTVQYGHVDEDFNLTLDADVKKYITQGGITDAFTQLKAVSVADHTIIVNTQKVAATLADTQAVRPDRSYVYFKSRHKGEHQITLKWQESGEWQTALWGVVTTTDTETNGLAGWFVTNLPEELSGKFTAGAIKSVLWIEPIAESGVDPNTMYVETDDPWGNQDMHPINKHEVSDLSDLPPGMPTTVIIKIGKDSDGGKEDYYMKYDVERSSWSEAHAWGLKYKFDESTLPHRLIRLPGGTFAFCPCPWTERRVGDDDSNPWPTFTGERINNVAFHKNRFWFLSKDNVISSQAGDFFNFFRRTVLEIMDDDPIDLSVASEMINTLISATSFEKGLILFGERAQFVLHSGDKVLSTKSVVIDETVRYNLNTTCNPVKMGSSIFFPCPQTNILTATTHTSKYLSLREYTVMPDTIIQDAPNVTIHVPRYIPNGLLRMTGCNQLDMLFVYSYSEPSAIYVQQFLWQGNEKIQQAWMKWTFDCFIWHIEVVGTYLYMLVETTANGFMFHTINLENVETQGEEIRYHLDQLIDTDTAGYNAGTDKTTFTLPYTVGTYVAADWDVIDGSTGLAFSKAEYTIIASSVIIDGNHTGKTIWVGKTYQGKYQFSEWYFKDEGGRPLISGNVQVKRLVLSFLNSGPFKVVTTPLNRDSLEEPLTEEMSGIKIGESTIGGVKLLTGEYSFMIAADTKLTRVEIFIDSHLPVSIQTAVWEAIFTMRGKGRQRE